MKTILLQIEKYLYVYLSLYAYTVLQTYEEKHWMFNVEMKNVTIRTY